MILACPPRWPVQPILSTHFVVPQNIKHRKYWYYLSVSLNVYYFFSNREIIRKVGYSFPVDIWAVGCIVYRLHYGVAPFDGSDNVEIYERILSTHVIYQRTNRYYRTLHQDELRVMRMMLKKNVKLRATIDQLLTDQYLQQQQQPDLLVPPTTTVNNTISKLDQMVFCLQQIATYNPTNRVQRLNYSQYHDARLTPSFWVHQSTVEKNRPNLIFYTYNNPNLYGCNFSDQSRMLHVNGQFLVYRSPSDNYSCFNTNADNANLSQELNNKWRTLLGKQKYMITKMFPKAHANRQFDVPIQIDPSNLDQLPWLERRKQFNGARRLLKAMRSGHDSHLFQIGYMYGSSGRSNRNNPNFFLLDTNTNSITIVKHNGDLCSVELNFVLADKCTATMHKYVQYAVKHISSLIETEYNT